MSIAINIRSSEYYERARHNRKIRKRMSVVYLSRPKLYACFYNYPYFIHLLLALMTSPIHHIIMRTFNKAEQLVNKCITIYAINQGRSQDFGFGGANFG